MENGVRLTLGHPENIAFDLEGESLDFGVISGHVRLFDAVSSVETFDLISNASPDLALEQNPPTRLDLLQY